jgi:hypothetical protein
MFNMLNELKQNEWKLDKLTTNNVVTKKIIKKPLKPSTNTTNSITNQTLKTSTNKPASNLSQQIDTARQAAKQRLLEAKKNAALIKQRDAAGIEEFSNDVCVLSTK